VRKPCDADFPDLGDRGVLRFASLELIVALETINTGNYDVGGFDINFFPGNHKGSKFVDMTVITKDAKFNN
jgi:hypothetical protein